MSDSVSGIYSGRALKLFISDSLHPPERQRRDHDVERGGTFFYIYFGEVFPALKRLSPAASHQLHHLILIGCDDPGQTAGQQHANQLQDRQKNQRVNDSLMCRRPDVHASSCKNGNSYLRERNPKRHSCNNGHVGFHEGSDQLKAALKHRGQVSPRGGMWTCYISKSEARRVCGSVSEAGVSIRRRQGF